MCRQVDKVSFIDLLHVMSDSTQSKLATPASIAVDLVLCAAFLVFIYSCVSSHVQSKQAGVIFLVGGLTSLCMTVVFWLCIQMFRVVYRAQRERKVSR